MYRIKSKMDYTHPKGHEKSLRWICVLPQNSLSKWVTKDIILNVPFSFKFIVYILLACSGTNTENLTSWFMLEGNLEINFSFYLQSLIVSVFWWFFFHVHQHTENRDEIYKPYSCICFHNYSCKLPSQENH